MKSHVEFGLLMLLCVATATDKAATGSAEAAVKVICPAIDLPVHLAPNGPPVFDARPPELVVVARTTRGNGPLAGNVPAQSSDEKPSDEYEVKKVLYGSYLGKTIRLGPSQQYWYDEPGDFVVAAVPGFYKEQPEYIACYRLPVSEERAEAALCQARLDFASLSSACIFIGKECHIGWREPKGDDDEEERDWNKSTVEVVRVIHGAPLEAGAKVRIADNGVAHNTDYHRRRNSQPRIYFVSPSKRVRGPGAVYEVYTHLPVDQEPKVIDALQHRNQCVVFDEKKDGQTYRCQEVGFRGTNTEAIDLLEAMHEGAVSLAYRTLMHRRKSARPDVVAAIGQTMFCMEPPKKDQYAGFRPLSRLIDLLGEMEREEGTGAIENLVEKYLIHIEQGAPEPPESPPLYDCQSEDYRTDINRSLTWLLMQLDENKSREKYGDRLLALRAKAVGRWKQEIQVALDAIKVEDSRELAAAMTLMKGVQPVRSRAVLQHKECGEIVTVFFSHDGKQLRSYGDGNLVYTWDAATMKMLRRVEIPTELKVMSIREPDGRYAVCFDAAAQAKALTDYHENQTNPAQVFDASTGTFIAKVALPIGQFQTRIHWIDDHEAIVAEETGLCRFDYLEGKVLSTLKIIDDESLLLNGLGQLTEDHLSILAFPGVSKGCRRVETASIDVATGNIHHRESQTQERVPACKGGLVPGGKYFYLADLNVYIYDRQTLKQVSKKVLDGIRVFNLSFAGDGRRYALVGDEIVFRRDVFKQYAHEPKSIIRIHDTLSGKTLLAFPASTRLARVKFSPDGKRLAVVNDDGTIEVWALPEG